MHRRGRPRTVIRGVPAIHAVDFRHDDREPVRATTVACGLSLRSQLRRRRQAQGVRDAAQPLVVRPELRSRGQSGSGQEVRVDVADAAPEQGVAINELQDFAIGSHDGGRQVQESGQHGFPVAEIAQGEFAECARMRFASSSAASAASPLRKWATQTDVSARITQRPAGAEAEP